MDKAGLSDDNLHGRLKRADDAQSLRADDKDCKMIDTTCPRCGTDCKNAMFDLMQIKSDGHCQICRAELSGKYADGKSTKLDGLILAARELRKASADYTASSEHGEIHYADAIHESVDLLIDALYDYEKGGEK